MNWVMVPVPEVIAPDVEAFLFRLKFRADVPRWDDELMDGHLRSLSVEARAVLSKVASAVMAHAPMQDAELARQMGVTVHELFGLVRDANDVTVGGASPGDIVYSRIEEIENHDGSLPRRRVLYMLEELAELIHDREWVLGLKRPIDPAG